MTCHTNPDSDYKGSYPFTDNEGIEYLTSLRDENSPLSLAEFGLDRLLPDWVAPDWRKRVLDIGPGRKLIPGAIRCDWPVFDFEAVRTHVVLPDGRHRGTMSLHRHGVLPYDDGDIGGIYAINILEHLWDPRPFLNECFRVLAPGCPLTVFVPHVNSIMYQQDLDHKKPFVLDTWKNLLDNPYYELGHAAHDMEIGVNFKFAVKEGNEAIITQLLKKRAA